MDGKAVRNGQGSALLDVGLDPVLENIFMELVRHQHHYEVSASAGIFDAAYLEPGFFGSLI